MVAAVVLDDEPRRRIVEVGPTHESTIAVTQILLNLRARKPGIDQEPPKSGFHWRFGGRGQSRQGAQSACPGTRKRGSISEAAMQRHVDRDKRLHLRSPPAQVGECPIERRCAQAPNDDCLLGVSSECLARRPFGTVCLSEEVSLCRPG